jgi:hypothetical protein
LRSGGEQFTERIMLAVTEVNDARKQRGPTSG